MSEGVDALVLTEYLPLFIGHRVWCRPHDKERSTLAESGYYEVVAVWEEDHPHDPPGTWTRRRGLIRSGYEYRVTNFAQEAVVCDVDPHLCKEPQFAAVWKPLPEYIPQGDPPKWDVLPVGQKPHIGGDLFTPVVSSQAETPALFDL
ncbi:hypothetical protein [Corynebacterium cystitidis]|uniref:hypothetical protein n=1 Tax=Corynebacterium cystitidis TaxID=35757 RepID=UPI00211EFB71|nr:hypothetical protein [Corynebacterium cystitidis]